MAETGPPRPRPRPRPRPEPSRPRPRTSCSRPDQDQDHKTPVSRSLESMTAVSRLQVWSRYQETKLSEDKNKKMASSFPRKSAATVARTSGAVSGNAEPDDKEIKVLGTNTKGHSANDRKSAAGQFSSQNRGSVLIGSTAATPSTKTENTRHSKTPKFDVQVNGENKPRRPSDEFKYKLRDSQLADSPYTNDMLKGANMRQSTFVNSRRDSSRRVFANRHLDLEKIKFYGFDMDYTLAVYSSPKFESFTFRAMIDRLIVLGYPAVIRDFEYDPTFTIRGLWCDYQHGTLLKTDPYGNILVATLGFEILPETKVRELYPNKFVQFDEGRFKIMNTLFELPEIYLASCLVDYFTNSPDFKSELTGVRNGELFMPYRSILTDVRDVTDYIHSHGTLKNDTIAKITEYVIKDERLPVFLDRIRGSGAKAFLLTNSPYDYTNSVMSYLLNQIKDGEVVRDWRSYFNYIVVDAQKPRFFRGGNTIREVDLTTGAKRLGIHEGPLETGKVYSGGSSEVFSKMIGARGPDVLYVGDHIFGDILKSKKERGWRTFLIVPEVAHELIVWTSNKALQDRLDELEDALKLAYIHLDSSSKTGPDTKKILDEIKSTAYQFDLQYGLLGSVFKSGSRATFFASQLQRYADIYSYCACNLLNYPFYYNFRAELMRMPHEATVDQSDTTPPSEYQQRYTVNLVRPPVSLTALNNTASTQGRKSVPHSRPNMPPRLTYYDEDDDEDGDNKLEEEIKEEDQPKRKSHPA